ncbi:hypothetical protein [Phaeocystidibacter luteus]|uniref:TonB C-terminal domain-containing protein n=1 Tax=Phaeocystidibacter luteus TaxID=911197 RepID=A0A6N6RK52_9FLAO|nr:hypothetical protein [Phaeocystidibacter luteus]KAB2814285.1 hypothetical protein F8C67_00715 [Phaeocystidibacter luteus]
MTLKNALYSTFAAVIFSMNAQAGPVTPVTNDVVPFPDEIKSAICSKDGSDVRGRATVQFHIDATGHVVLEEVEASTVGLNNHIWNTVHGMETADTSLVSGKMYTVTLDVQ